MSEINSNSLLKGWVTEIIINAPQQLVWDKIVDFEAYKNWNPFMLEAKAELKVDSYLRFLEDLKEFGQYWLTAKFLSIQEPNELVWQGSFRANFLFRVRHSFKLESLDEQQTRLIHSHRHRGILRPYLAYRGVFQVSRQGYILYNEALKKLCEEHYINKPILS